MSCFGIKSATKQQKLCLKTSKFIKLCKGNESPTENSKNQSGAKSSCAKFQSGLTRRAALYPIKKRDTFIFFDNSDKYWILSVMEPAGNRINSQLTLSWLSLSHLTANVLSLKKNNFMDRHSIRYDAPASNSNTTKFDIAQNKAIFCWQLRWTYGTNKHAYSFTCCMHG